MKIKESCKCGAQFEAEGEGYELGKELDIFRKNHKLCLPQTGEEEKKNESNV
jgi:hypothetical protein